MQGFFAIVVVKWGWCGGLVNKDCAIIGCGGLRFLGFSIYT